MEWPLPECNDSSRGMLESAEQYSPWEQVKESPEVQSDDNSQPAASASLLESPDGITALHNKINDRARVLFIYTCDIFGNDNIRFTSGDKQTKTLLGTDDIESLSFNGILGPATCSDTVKRIYSALSVGCPHEAFLNIYDRKGKPISAFLSFRINKVSPSSNSSSSVVCGVLNIARASVPGNIKFFYTRAPSARG